MSLSPVQEGGALSPESGGGHHKLLRGQAEGCALPAVQRAGARSTAFSTYMPDASQAMCWQA